MAFLDFVDPIGIFHDGNIAKGLGIDPNAKSDQENYRDQMQRQLAGLATQMPNFYDMYKQSKGDILGSVKAPTPYSFNPFDTSSFESGINKQYDLATQNLNRTIGGQVMNAQSSAAAQAAARGVNNPTGYAKKVGMQTRQAFAPQLGAIEQARAGALSELGQKAGFYNNQGLNNVNQMNVGQQNDFAKYQTQLMQSLSQMGINAQQMDWANKMGIFNAQNGMTSSYDPYTGWDKAVNFATNVIPQVAKAFV